MTREKTPEEVLRELKTRLEDQLKLAPKAIRRVARVIRRGNLKKFRRFLRQSNINIPNNQADSFRDYLITQRIDLKDMEPMARARLRMLTIKQDDDQLATGDYLAATSAGVDLRCVDCSWFAMAPNDGDGENAEKTCIQLGAKGVDEACIGFEWNTARLKSA